MQLLIDKKIRELRCHDKKYTLVVERQGFFETVMKIGYSPLVLASTTLFAFHFRSAIAIALAQTPFEPDGTTTDGRTDVALISINNKPYQIPLGDQVIPTDIVPPRNVTEASVYDGPQGFGCFFSERGSRPIGTFTVEDPIPRSSSPPETPGDAKDTSLTVDNADTLTCFNVPAKSFTYLVWLLYADGSDYYENGQNNFAIDIKEGIRQSNGGSKSSNFNTLSHSPKEELIFVQAGSIVGVKEFKDPGRPVAKAMLVDAPYPQSVCLLHFAPVTTGQSGSSSEGPGMKQFDLLDAAELEEGQLAHGIHCFRGW